MKIYDRNEFKSDSREVISKENPKNSTKNFDQTNNTQNANKKMKIIIISSLSVIIILAIILIIVFVVIKKKNKTAIEEKSNYLTTKYLFTKGKESKIFHPEVVDLGENEYQIEINFTDSQTKKRGLLEIENNYGIYTSDFDGKALVKIKFNTLLKHIDFLFQGCEDLLYADFSNFDSSEITGMSSTFMGATNLEKVNLNSINSSKITSMDFLFAGCENLAEVLTENLNTTNVQTMSGMFIGCKNLLTVNLTSFKISNSNDLAGMFAGCSSLKALDLSAFGNIDYVFDDLSNNNEITIKVDFNKINVTHFNLAFSGKLKMIDKDEEISEIDCVIGDKDKCKNCNEEKGKKMYCKECNSGYYLPTNEISPKTKCQKCENNCTECFMVNDEIQCSSCEENYTLFEGRCIENCKIGDNDSCASCNFDGKNNECLTCNPGYYLDENTKTSCKIIEIDLCIKAKMVSGNVLCTECESGYGVKNNECVEMCVTGEKEKCASCDLSNEKYTSCLTCNEGYYLPDDNDANQGFCLPCTENCKKCEGNSTYTKCNECNDGYNVHINYFYDCFPGICRLYKITDCRKCLIDHCIDCSFNEEYYDIYFGGTACLACEKGYILAYGVCIKACEQNESESSFCKCPIFDTENNCVTCKDGFISLGLMGLEMGDFKWYFYNSREFFEFCYECGNCIDYTFKYNGTRYSCLFNSTKHETLEKYNAFLNQSVYSCFEEICDKGEKEKCRTCLYRYSFSQYDLIPTNECGKCNPGYYLPNDDENKTACSPCGIENCTICYGDSNNVNCSKCENNLLASGDKCVKSCIIGPNKLCKSCSLNEGEYDQCSECNSGYFLPTDSNDKTKCKKVENIIDHCKEYNGSTTNYVCSKCINGYTLYNSFCKKNCKKGRLSKCKSCNLIPGENDQCLTCNDGYYLPTDYNEKIQCFPCGIYCKSCNGLIDNSYCTQCYEGYVNVGGKCEKRCEDRKNENCKICGDDEKCSKCDSGYYIPTDSDGTTCQKCSLTGCEICEGTTLLNECKQCYLNDALLKDGKIVECSVSCDKGEGSKCETCSNEVKGNCGSCNSDYNLVEGKCITRFSVVAEYVVNDITEATKLMNYNYIMRMKINGAIIDRFKTSNKYKFDKPGTYIVEMMLDSFYTSGCNLFTNITNLVSIKFLLSFRNKIKWMNNMFKGCVNLQKADLSGLNLEYTGCMQHYFHYCHKLTEVIFPNSNINAINTHNLEYMFAECHELTSIDLSSFNIDYATYIHFMFYDTPKLTSIRLFSSTKKIRYNDNMFVKAAKNATIIIKKNTHSSVTDQIPKDWIQKIED